MKKKCETHFFLHLCENMWKNVKQMCFTEFSIGTFFFSWRSYAPCWSHLKTTYRNVPRCDPSHTFGLFVWKNVPVTSRHICVISRNKALQPIFDWHIFLTQSPNWAVYSTFRYILWHSFEMWPVWGIRTSGKKKCATWKFCETHLCEKMCFTFFHIFSHLFTFFHILQVFHIFLVTFGVLIHKIQRKTNFEASTAFECADFTIG